MHFLFNRYSPTYFIVFSAIFIALNIIFTHIFSIQATFIRIGFGFLPTALFSMLFGPLAGGLVAAIADILGCLLFSPGLYFPGFTLSAFWAGAIYGYFLHDTRITMQKVAVANILIILFVDLVLNTFWLSILFGQAGTVFIGMRLIKCAVLLPLQIAIVYSVASSLAKYGFMDIVKRNQRR